MEFYSYTLKHFLKLSLKMKKSTQVRCLSLIFLFFSLPLFAQRPLAELQMASIYPASVTGKGYKGAQDNQASKAAPAYSPVASTFNNR
jgi:hypothetical protein